MVYILFTNNTNADWDAAEALIKLSAQSNDTKEDLLQTLRAMRTLNAKDLTSMRLQLLA